APDGEGGGRGGDDRGRLDAGRSGGPTAGRRGSRLVLRGGRDPLSRRVVAVEAAPGLAPEAPGGDQRALQRVRPEAGLLVERAVDALAGGEVHVDADQVEELERAHAEAGAAYGGVDGRDRHAVGVEPYRLEVEGPREAVHHEAGRVLDDDGLALEPPHQVDGLRHD